MGQPVVHFEVMGNDTEKLWSFYSELFDWSIDADNPLGYGVVDRTDNPAPEGLGSIGGGVGAMPEGAPWYVTFYVGVPDVEAALRKAESLGGTRVMGPEQPMEGLEIALFTDPEGHVIGLVRGQG
ncbi:MAG TPA: VOC family protein [Acidimicrobiia bacterium]|nr:VOC family protein [Acidimicrobiia bacterium]